MTRSAWAAVVIVAALVPACSAALAQQADPPLNDTQQLGRRLFVQSCGVCHMNVQRTSTRYGPALSRDSLGGQDNVMREVISNGTPRMPGFRHYFESGQIDAIVAYLKTVPAAPAASSPPGAPAAPATTPGTLR